MEQVNQNKKGGGIMAKAGRGQTRRDSKRRVLRPGDMSFKASRDNC